MKVLTVISYCTEYEITKAGNMYKVEEYRDVRAFRGYRTVKIKPVLMSREQVKALIERARKIYDQF